VSEHTFTVTLTLPETANLDALLRKVIMTCGFRDAADNSLANDLIRRLAPKDPKDPQAATLQLTLSEARLLWDFLAGVRCSCKFDSYPGWEFVEQMQDKIHNSAKNDSAWFNVKRFFPREGTAL
jgi:hypothetical protein